MKIKKICLILAFGTAALYGTQVCAEDCRMRLYSYTSHNALKVRYKNCENCGSRKENNLTAYYCECDCPPEKMRSQKK